MAVAVKNAPVSAAPSPFDRMAVVSLAGAAYVIASLGIVFGVLPYVWQAIPGLSGIGGDVLLGVAILAVAAGLAVLVARLIGSTAKLPVGYNINLVICVPAVVFFFALRAVTGLNGIGADVLLGLVMVVVATVLAVLGVRLLGPNQPAGARAGIFTAVVLFIVALVLARWAGMWLESWVYYNHLFGPSGATVGLALTGAILLVLVGAAAYLFFRPEVEKYLLVAEGQGWFNATSYKGLQGQRVRRGTILGILLIAGSGVYTMMNNGFLNRLPENWALNVPFTGAVSLEDPGDAGRVGLLRDLPASEKTQVRIVANGPPTFEDGAVVSVQAYRDALKARIDGSPDLDAAAKDRLKQEVDKKDITDILNLPGASDSLTAAVGTTALTALPPAGLPTAEPRIDLFTYRNVNDQLNQKYVRVADAGLSSLKTGAVVTKEEFEKAADAPELKGVTNGQPVSAPPVGAAGPFSYQPLTLLPALHYTLPLLLLALALWGAWRVVNFPPFADFLIATEAELNKVSWTTRSRLIKDTIVVLVTVALMAIFLFSMDQLWHHVLSWKPIGVLQIPDENSDKNKSAENLKW